MAMRALLLGVSILAASACRAASEGESGGESALASSRWQPRPGTSWQWQLSGTIDTSVNASAYDIDLFTTAQSTIDALHSAGRKVVCYFSAGSHEPGRPDSNDFPPSAVGKVMDGWPDEKWLDVRSSAVKAIMQRRLDVAVQKKCDGVEPDNVDGYQNDTGFALTGADQLAFNRFLASEAHGRQLAVALKNDVDQITALVADFDFALNEECAKYSECDAMTPFIQANKAVFNVEYGAASLAQSVCPAANRRNFDTLVKKLDLDAWRVACR
jgi:hypothetical protein